MKFGKISANERALNIIKNALEYGLEFKETDSLEEIRIMAQDFLEKAADVIEVQCEVTHCGGSQHVEWSDEFGYIYESFGEIENRRHYKKDWKSPDTKIFHSDCFNSKGEYIRLYELLGENEYNVPEGYFYCPKNKRHELKEDENNF